MRKLPVVPFCRSRLISIFGNELDSFPKSEAYSAPSRAHLRGASRSSRTWSAGCDGRFGDACDLFVRTSGTEADAKACGPGLPTLRPSRVVTSRATTGARKPGSRGERAISVKTVAQGMPDDLAEPVVPSPCFFMHGGHGLRPAPGIPCALCCFGGLHIARLGRDPRRERAVTCPLSCLTSESERPFEHVVPRRGRGARGPK
jgi:hypothetical protein